MNTYNSLSPEIMKGLSNTDKPSAPVNVGQTFKNKLRGDGYKNCTIVELSENGFRYEYENKCSTNAIPSSMWISYSLWSKRSFKRNNIYYIN